MVPFPTSSLLLASTVSGGWKILEEAFLQKTDIICLPPLPPPLLWMHLRPLCPKGSDDSSQVFPLPPQPHCPRANQRSEWPGPQDQLLWQTTLGTPSNSRCPVSVFPPSQEAEGRNRFPPAPGTSTGLLTIFIAGKGLKPQPPKILLQSLQLVEGSWQARDPPRGPDTGQAGWEEPQKTCSGVFAGDGA